MDKGPDSEVLSEVVDPDRRAFVKRVAAVTAFAVPMIASYDLQSLSPSVAHAAFSSNLTAVESDVRLKRNIRTLQGVELH
jgi:hypothetical protein